MTLTKPAMQKIIATEVLYQKGYWDDMRFPAFGLRLDSPSGRLAYNVAEKGVDFADTSLNTDGDGLHVATQTTHKMKLGSTLHPHIHFFQNQATLPAWKLNYRVYENGQLVPASFTELSVIETVFNYASGTLAQIVVFPTIDMSAFDQVSTMLDFRITRESASDTYTGNALIKEFDMHYEIDTPGSRQRFIK